MQMFLDFNCFWHRWKCCLIKNNIANYYYPCACFLAHKQPDGEFKKLKSWNDLIKSPTSKLIFVSLINSLLRVFVDKLAVTNTEGCFNAFSVCVVELVAFPFLFQSFTIFFIKSSLNVLCILWNFWLASIQIGYHAWYTSLMNQVCWKEKKIQALVVCCYIQSCNHKPNT